MEKIMILLEKQKQIKNKLKKQHISFWEAELQIRGITNEIEAILQEDTFNELTESTYENTILCECGHKAIYKGNRSKIISTGRTKISLSRRTYHCANCSKTISPLDKDYGLENAKGFSPLLISTISFLAAKMSYEETKNVLKEVSNINISSTAVQNQSEKLGKKIFQNKLDYLPAYVQQPCEKMVLLVDGGMLHTGKETYKETRVGVIIKFYLNKGFSVHKLAICENAESFNKDIYDFAVLHGSNTSNQIVIIGDGAKWIDSLKMDYFPSAKRIIDIYHAKEYLISALKEIYGENWRTNKHSKSLFGLLENGECLELSGELERYICSEDKSSNKYKAKRYFLNNHEAMNYKRYEAEGLSIGSGEVEGAVRHIVHDRMGKSRSKWTICDANAILILRAYILNGYWEYMKQKLFQRRRNN